MRPRAAAAIEGALAAFAPAGWAWAVLPVRDRHDELRPEEAALADGWAPRRVWGFSTGRAAARRALEAAGCGRPGAILPQGRAPAAPAGFRLSITHTDDFAVAVACAASDAAGIGVDLERIDRMDVALARRIVLPGDRFPDGHGVVEMTVAFSLRESLFKALDAERQAQLQRIDLTWSDDGILATPQPALDVRLDHWVALAQDHVLTLARRSA